MKRVVQIALSGHPTPFTLDQEADGALESYLDQARLRLEADPDREEVLRDLEQSIADKLARLPHTAGRVVARREVESALEEIGAVDAGQASIAAETRPEHPRRIFRIQQGRWLAGVCQGLAAYSSIRVSRVRSIVVLLSLFIVFLGLVVMFSSFTLGLLVAASPAAVYFGLMFTSPLIGSADEVLSHHRQRAQAQRAQAT